MTTQTSDPGALLWALGGIVFWCLIAVALWKIVPLVRGLLGPPLRWLEGWVSRPFAWLLRVLEPQWMWLAVRVRRTLRGLVRALWALLGWLATQMFQTLKWVWTAVWTLLSWTSKRLGEFLRWLWRMVRWLSTIAVRGTPDRPKIPAPAKEPGDEFRGVTEEIVGLATWWLLTHPGDWINRVVESVVFLDDVTVRRQTSVDFTLPVNFQVVSPRPGSTEVLVPLALLEKQSLTRFDLYNDRNKALPMLNTHQNVEVAGACLTVCAAQVVRSMRPNEKLPSTVRRDLYRVAGHGGADSESASSQMWTKEDGNAELRKALKDDEVLRGLVNDLQRYFLVLVPVKYDRATPGTVRQIIKFAFDERPFLPRPRWRMKRFWKRPRWHLNNALARTSLRAHAFEFHPLAVGSGASFHFEVAAPEDLEIAYATITASAPSDPHFQVNDREPATVERAHLHVSDAPREAVGTARVVLRARKPGLLRAAALSAIAAAILLHVGVSRVQAVVGDSHATNVRVVTSDHSITVKVPDGGSREAAAALLLLLPTVLIAYLGRPGEHILASWLLAGTRLVLLLVSLCLFAAAAMVALGYREGLLGADLPVLAWVATAGAVFLSVGALWPAGRLAMLKEERRFGR